MNQKGFAPIILLVLIIPVIIGVGAYVFFSYHGISNNKQNTGSQSLSEPSPTSAASNSQPKFVGLSTEIAKAPLYPDSTFIKQKKGTNFRDCKIAHHLCDTNEYIFKTSSSIDEIKKYYNSQPNLKFTPGTEEELHLIDSKLQVDSDIYSMYLDKGGSGALPGEIKSDEVQISFILPQEDYNWPVASDTELKSWNTYTDPNNIFSVKYPKGWRLTKSVVNDNYVTPDKECKQCGGSESGIYFHIGKKGKGYIYDYSSEESFENSFDHPVVIKNLPQFFNNLDVKVVDGLSGGGNPGLRAIIAKGDNQIEVYSDGTEEDLVSKIFSTFKFTN